MGRQINFYVAEETQSLLNKHILDTGYLLLDQYGDVLGFDSIEKEWGLYLYKPSYGELVYRNKNNRLDIMRSPIIELWQGKVLHEQKTILRGRFWVETFVCTENGWKEKPEQLMKDYQSLVRLVNKYVSKQDIKCGAHYVKEYTDEEAIRLQNEEGYRLTGSL